MLAAVESGDKKKLAALIRQDPGFKVNMAVDDGYGFTLLHAACWGSDDSSAVIPLLLAHPDIDVNAKDRDGETPFLWACDGRASCLREMLRDSRVSVNEPDNGGYTPLWFAAFSGHVDVTKWWIASGREIDLGEPGDVDKTDAIGRAKKNGETELVALLENFKSDAAQTRQAMRVELGLLDELAAEMFALVVFISDGLLQVNDTTTTPAARFFSITRRLPLELQMIVSHWMVGSPGEIIPSKDSEVAFKSLAERLLWSSLFTN